jgi:uncharacterized protein (TIGR02001 family)
MRKSILGLSAFALAAIATPAFADDAAAVPAVKVSGNVALVSDYRFRGFSQTQEDPAVQGGITLTHKSGVYASFWASTTNIPAPNSVGVFDKSLNTELDLILGYSHAVVPGVTVDGGLLYYVYPARGIQGGYDTDFFEPYLNLTGTYGPAALKVGVNFAPSQGALPALDGTSHKSSAIYLHAEPSVTIPNTPLGLNAHVGWAKSDSFLGGYDANHEVVDYSFGATATWRNLTVGVSYVNTDQNKVGFFAPGKEATHSDGAAVFSLTAAF